MSDDQALLLRYTRSRDAVAFAELVKRYSTLVFSVANRVTGNPATAEDVTQDCFFALARHAASIRSSLPAWLHRTALNRSLVVTRSEAIRHRHEARVAPPSDQIHEAPWKNIAPLVDEALAKLPDDLREPLVQHFLLGRTQSQVAENLHIDQGTVSRRLQSGIKMLRQRIEEGGVFCSVAVLSTSMVKNASAAVPAKLSAALAKMAMAGPAAFAAAATTSAILGVNAKLIAAIVSVFVVGAAVTTSLMVMNGGQTDAPVTAESLAKGLILHFTFDKAETDGKVIDASEEKNNGKVTGAEWTKNGKKSGAYVFSADGHQIIVPNNKSLNPKQITLSAWINTSTKDAIWRRIFDKSYSTGYALSIAGDWEKTKWRGLAAMEIGPGMHITISDNTLVDGKWHHIVLTFDGSRQLMYIDGRLQSKPLQWKEPGEVGSNNFDLTIGCNRSNLNEPDLGTSFRGTIDEPMIWNRALSADEVKFLFESQR
jgi:RNA polymerase sigma factor (sigma-70 family)